MLEGGQAGVKQLRRLLDAVVEVGRDLTLPAVLERITSIAVGLVGARYGALGVLDVERRRLDEFVVVGLDEAEVAAIGARPQGHGILGLLIVDPRPIRLPDLQEHADRFGFPPGHPPMTSFLGVPIFVAGQVYGNLYLTDKAGGDVFTDVDEELAVAYAAAAGIAIDNARMHARLRTLDVLEDRDRIARDLHDTVIQRLFATGLSLQGATTLAAPPELRARLERAVDDLDTTVRQVRSAIFDLHPPRTAGRSVRQGLLALRSEVATALGFEPAVDLHGPVDSALRDADVHEVLSVAREALANVARHARATRVDVRAVVADGWFVLTVTDDGVGPGPGAGGRGIANMEARAHRLGGTSSVEAEPGGGTMVRWAVPLRR